MDELKAIDHKVIDKIISRAFQEDIDKGDVTTESIVDKNVKAGAFWKAKEPGVIAGLDIGKKVFQALDAELEWNPACADGDKVAAGTVIVEMQGSCRAILTAERTALNMVQRISGIATKTHKFVKALEGFSTKILDTRKTPPGLRHLDKFAVRAGGGMNHRMGLYDLAMIKDNHIIAAGSIEEAVNQVRGKNPDIKIEVETNSLQQVKKALAAEVNIIMLDNMSISQMRKAVSVIGSKAKTEASGNITYERLKKVAETGVTYISSGALTHSVEAFDISQQIQRIS